MNKLPIAKSVAREYLRLQKRLRTNKKLVEFLKIGALRGVTLFFIGVYIYFVNQGSTLGFFLRQEQRELEKIEFNYSLIAIQSVQEQKLVREQVMSGNKYMNSEVDTPNFSLEKILMKVQYSGDKLEEKTKDMK